MSEKQERCVNCQSTNIRSCDDIPSEDGCMCMDCGYMWEKVEKVENGERPEDE